MMALALSWPKQLTYPIDRWPACRLDQPEEREKLFVSILTEGNVRAGCEKLGIHHSTVYRYKHRDKEFAAQFDAVCDDLHYCLRDDAVRLADEGYNTVKDALKAALLRLKIEARLRVAGLHKPQTVVNVDNRQVNVEVNDPERARLIEMRKRALEQGDSK